MSKQQLRAFCLMYAMLKTILQTIGYKTDDVFLKSCEDTFNSIVSKVVD